MCRRKEEEEVGEKRKQNQEGEINYTAQWLCHGHCLWDKKSGQEEEKRGGGRAEGRGEVCDLREKINQQHNRGRVQVFCFGVISGTSHSEGYHPSADSERRHQGRLPATYPSPGYLRSLNGGNEGWAPWNAIWPQPASSRSPTLNS